MASVNTELIKITTTGSAGSATGSATTPILDGILFDVFIDYHASAPATTDVTISFANGQGDLLTVSDNNADASYPLLQEAKDSSGNALGVYTQYALNGKLTVSVAQADALTDCVKVHLRYLQD
jgi:hypothetical protein